MIWVVLVGYINVGKFIFMNLLSKLEVFVENKFFVILDIIVWKVVIDCMFFLFFDIVGFIWKFLYYLVESFKFILDEVWESDILFYVVDIVYFLYEDYICIVNSILKDLEVVDKFMLLVFNKIDFYWECNYDDLLMEEGKWEIEEGLFGNLCYMFDQECMFVFVVIGENIDEFWKKFQ